jgi:hypothetical protein
MYFLLMVSVFLRHLSAIQDPSFPVFVESSKTQSGELVIRRDEDRCRFKVTLDGKTILKTDCDVTDADDWQIGIFAHYAYPSGAVGELFILQQTTGGNACGGSYRFLLLKQDGSYSLSQNVGNCNFPIVTFGLDAATIRFPGGKARHGASYIPPEIYAFKNGSLQRLKPAR